MQKIICEKWKNTLTDKFEEADSFRNEGHFCDVSLRSNDGIAIKAHRVILSMGSNYFKDLFTSGMSDSSADSLDYRLIKGEILEKVIGFIYTGEIEVDNPEHIEEITRCANFFQLAELIEECVELLTSLIDNNNCLRFWRLGRECFSNKFEKWCISHIVNACDLLFQNESFLNEVEKDELETLLKEDGLKCSEEQKFQAVYLWTKNMTNSSTELSAILSDYLKSIKLFSLSKEFIFSNILQNKDLIDNKDVLEAIGKSAEIELDSASENMFAISNLMKSREDLLAIQSKQINVFSTDGDMKIIHQKSSNSIRFASMTFNNFAFICGGQNEEGQTINSCKYFIPFTKNWCDLPALNNRRYFHECNRIDKKIYVCGGRKDDNTILSSVEIFDFREEKWISGPEMNLPRHGFGFTSINRSLYAVGGCTTSSIDLLDPRMSNVWNVIYNGNDIMQSYTKCAADFNDIYCFNAEKVYIFDTRTNKIRFWENKNSYKPTDKIFQICNIDDHLYMIRHNPKELKKYDLNGNLIYSKILTTCNSCFGLVPLNYMN